MDITPATTVGTGRPGPGPGHSGPAAITSDFNTFLRMLTAQISIQDPLYPMNAEQFAVQLATFSGVEQQVRTNQLLESMVAVRGQSDFGQMAAWVGMQARAPMPVPYQGTPLSVTPEPPIAGTRHEIVVLNDAGDEVWRGRHLPGRAEVWGGTRQDGSPAGAGLYSFRLDSFEADRLVATAPVPAYGTIEEVRMERGTPLLVFAGGVERAVGEVSALRRARGG